MKVNPINSQQKIITPKTTGYAATVGLALTTYSGITKNKTVRKTHKPFAYLTAIFTAIHIALIEYKHYQYKKQYSQNN